LEIKFGSNLALESAAASNSRTKSVARMLSLKIYKNGCYDKQRPYRDRPFKRLAIGEKPN